MLRTIAAAALAAFLFTTGAYADECTGVNAAGTVGYVNVREFPHLEAPVIIRWNNPENGSDWGSGRYCQEEYFDGERVWSKVYLLLYDGRNVEGWVSDSVLEFV